MKNRYLLIVSLLLCLCCTLQAKNKVIDQPPFCVRSTTSIEVSKIVLSDTATVLHIFAKYRPKNWIRISAGSYLKDNNGETYPLRSGIGITPNKEFWMPESGEATFQLVFPPLSANATSIDLTEGEGVEDAFSIWGIQLKNKKLPDLPLPKEAVVHKADANAKLPEPVIQYGKAILKGKLLGFRPNMSIPVRVMVSENVKGSSSEVLLEILPDGSFTKETILVSTSSCTMHIGTMSTVRFFMEPGKTTELYVNLREISRRESKFHNQKPPYGEAAYVNGPLEVVAQELNRSWNDIDIQEKLIKNINTLADKDIDSAKEYILAVSEEIQATIDKLPCSASTRQLLSIDNKLNSIVMINSVPALLTSAAIRTNRIKKEEGNSYYAEFIKKFSGNQISGTELIILNDSQSTLSDRYMNATAQYLNKAAELSKTWGTDKGLFFDMTRNFSFYHSIKNFIPFTKEQEAAISTLPTAYREMLTAANNKLLAQIEANKAKTGYTINKVDANIGNEDLFASILRKYQGKVVLVDFWATWCGPCRTANKVMAPMKEELKGEDIVYLYITGETSPLNTWENMIPDIHGEHCRVTNAQWKYLGETFKIEGVPTYLVVDRKGEVKFKQTGFPGVEKIKEELLKATKP